MKPVIIKDLDDSVADVLNNATKLVTEPLTTTTSSPVTTTALPKPAELKKRVFHTYCISNFEKFLKKAIINLANVSTF